MERERWGGTWIFVFAAIASAIGLGNVWRFPYLVYNYGGGAFLIPYIVSLIVIGIPWFIAEVGMGQIMQKGAPGTMASIGKRFEWIGWFSVWVAFFIISYYTVVLAWSVLYLVYSTTLPWGVGVAAAEKVKPFFFGDVLGLTNDISDWGSYQSHIILALVFVWLVIYWIVYKDIERLGRLVKWTVIIPWILILILIVRGVTLDGADVGLEYYLKPDFSAIMNGEVWFAAVSQVAFTLSLGMAIMFAYGSYKPEKEDVNATSVVTAFSDAATAFFAGIAVFSTLGFLAIQLSAPVDKVVASGIGLAFLTYPLAISMMETWAQVIGIAFFTTLFLLGLGSAVSLARAIITAVQDKWGYSTKKATNIVTIPALILGVILFTPGSGLYWLDIIDRAVSFYGLILAGLLQIIVIAYFYGAEKLRSKVNEVSFVSLGKWFDYSLKFIVPLGMIYVLAWGFYSDVIKSPHSYGGYPIWATAIALWGLLLLIFVLSVLSAVKSPKEVSK